MNLDERQMEAVHHVDGPALVLAGPGSGKTAVITERTRYLVQEQGIDPRNILVITFTKAAAVEMRQRFEKLMGQERCPVTFGTFHAVFFQILKHAYNFRAENIMREEVKYQLVRDLIVKRRLEYEDEGEFVNNIIGEISLVKNTGIPISHYYAKNCGEDVFRTIFLEYEEKKHHQRLIDFDDMLVYTYELFSERKDILQAWQRKYRYILIDEFQDINKIQYDVVRMLAEPENHLFIVGDDDQSIYRFRGARPEIMLHFPKDYPDAKEILLNRNYRCQGEIVEKSLNLISYNKARFSKQIIANREKEKEIVYEMVNSAKEENRSIIQHIQDFMEKSDYRYSDFAVLFRTNTQPRLLMEQFMDYNIPFRTKDKIPNLYEHWIAQDLFAYIRLSEGGRARKDMLRVMNRPKRYLSRDCLDEEVFSFEVLEMYYEEQPWVVKRLDRMQYDLKMLRNMSPFAAINYIRKGIGYDDFIQEYADYRRINEADLYEILDEIQTASKDYKDMDAWEAHIRDYSEELVRQSKEIQARGEAVSLATLHSSKGLEYRVVFIIDVNDGVMPYRKPVLEEELEEERRMFYVGMTRAKEQLFLYSVKEMNNHPVDVSEYIAQCQRPCPKQEEKVEKN